MNVVYSRNRGKKEKKKKNPEQLEKSSRRAEVGEAREVRGGTF